MNHTTPCLHIFIHHCITMLVFLSRPFSLDHFDDYQKHYTVMNYAEDVQLKQVQKLCLGYMLRSVRLISDDQYICFPSDSLWWIYPHVWEPVSTVSMETGWGMALCTSNFPYSGPVKYSQDWSHIHRSLTLLSICVLHSVPTSGFTS